MIRTKLYTRAGELVTEVILPPFVKPVELVVWGERFFVLDDGNYREADGSFFVPPEIVVPDEARAAVTPLPRGKTTTDGEPPEEGRWDAPAPKPIDPETGQHGAYWVLSEEDRAKGHVRPVRKKYIHVTCGGLTKMGLAIAETYARNPGYYGKTFCFHCKDHFPVGKDGEFVWDGSGPKGQVFVDKVDYSAWEKVGA